MSAQIDPKQCGKCWSCQYCTDISTQRINDHDTYVRNCIKSGHNGNNRCVDHCTDYVWDGHTTDHSGTPTPAPSASSKKKGFGAGYVVAIILVVIVVIVGSLLPSLLSGEPAVAPQDPVTYETEAEIAEDSLNIKAKVVTKNKSLNLRGGPSTNYDTIGTLPKGAIVIIHQIEGSWAYIEYDGTFGWCSVNYLEEQ